MDIFRQLNTRTWSIVSAEGQASVECASCRRSCVERPRAISVEVRKSIDASSAVHDEALLQALAILKRLSYPKVERLPAEQLRVSLEGVFCDVRLSARTCRFYAATSRILPHRSGSATTTCGGGHSWYCREHSSTHVIVYLQRVRALCVLSQGAATFGSQRCGLAVDHRLCRRLTPLHSIPSQASSCHHSWPRFRFRYLCGRRQIAVSWLAMSEQMQSKVHYR